MKMSKRAMFRWMALAMAVGAGGAGITGLGVREARAGEADEAALAERIAVLADRFGGSSGTAAFRESMFDGAGRLAEKEVRFRRSRFQAASTLGDPEIMLRALDEWRKLDPANLYVQTQLINVHLVRLQTTDQRLEYLRKIVGAESVNAEVRSHAALHSARLLLEQSRGQQALEMLRRSLVLNGMNADAMRLHWQMVADRAMPAQRLDMLLAMLKANPASVDVVLLVAGELADANLVQYSLQWYGHAAGMSRSLGGLVGSSAKDYAAELLIAGQDRAAAEVTSRLLTKDPTDPGAWFLTLLAEKGMQDRIAEVRKNAQIGLLNRLAAVRSQIGVQGATTRPLGSEEVTMPDLAGDAALLKNATPEATRNYLEAVSDVVWFLLVYADRPADAQPLLKALAATGKADANLLACMEGWSLLKSAKAEEARAKFAPLIEKDPLAGIGMVHVYQQDPASGGAAAELARKLIVRYPSRAIGAMVRSEVGAVAGDVAPDPSAEPMRDALDRFPREIFRMAAQPQDFLAMRLSPLQVGHDFAEPILVEVELRNTSNAQGLPIMLGPSGMARDYWLDVQCRGLVSPWVPGPVYDKIDGPTVLAPGASVRWITRLDRGPLASILQQTVQQSMQMNVLGLTNAVPSNGAIVPGPCGIRGTMGKPIERRAAYLASDAAMQRANAIVSANDPVLKLRMIDQVTAHLAIAADPEGKAEVKNLEAEFKDMLIRLGQDAAPTVRAWARYRLGQIGAEPAQKVASDLAADQVWFARLLGAATVAESPEAARPQLLEAAGNDPDATVRRAVLALPGAIAAQAEAQKQ